MHVHVALNNGRRGRIHVTQLAEMDVVAGKHGIRTDLQRAALPPGTDVSLPAKKTKKSTVEAKNGAIVDGAD